MKLIAKNSYNKKYKEVVLAYFDVGNILSFLGIELFVKVFIRNNTIKIVFPELVKKKLKCYCIDLKQLENACCKHILNNNDNLLPPNYYNTEYDHVSLLRQRKQYGK